MSHVPPARPRVREPQREGQIVWRVTEDSLPLSHPARLLWEVLGTLELSVFLAKTKAVEGTTGRRNHSMRMLLTLWLYAYCQGETCARAIVRLTRTDFAYRWIAGDMDVCHDRLSRVRREHRAELNALYTRVLGALLNKGLISLDLVATDGTRVRASAGAASFRSEQGLAACEEQARLHLKAMLAQQDDPKLSVAQKARRLSAAQDFLARVAQAKAQLASRPTPEPPRPPTGTKPARRGPKPTKPVRSAKKPRASTTDPEARVMKMGDGGYRPAFNVQLATAGSPLGGPRTVVGLLISNLGGDMGSLVPIANDIEARTGQKPKVLLADGNHAKHDDIEALSRQGVRVLVPVPDMPQTEGTYVRHSLELDAWRADVQSEEARTLYRARAGLSELSNAHLKTGRGVDAFVVRGMGKVVCVVLMSLLSTTLLQHASALLA